MPFKRNFDEWADQYLNGNMNRQEQLDFEKAIEEDKALEEIYNQHKRITFDLKKLGRRLQLRKKLETIEANQFKKENNLNRKNLYKWTAAAASIVLISVVTTLFTAGYLTQKRQANKFNELKREVDQMKYNQRVLVTDYNNKTKNSLANYGGTGFLISEQGYLVTNYHVVSSSDSLYISNNDGVYLKVELVLASREYDLAILKIIDDSFLRDVKIPYSFSFGNEQCNLGERLFTLGFPKEDIVYGEGYLSSRAGYYGDTTSYQISLALNPGNSGGPLFNEKGKVVGVISGKQDEKEGVAFAIKSEYIQKMIEMTEQSLDIKISLPQNNKNKVQKQNNKTDLIQQMENYVFQIRVFGA